MVCWLLVLMQCIKIPETFCSFCRPKTLMDRYTSITMIDFEENHLIFSNTQQLACKDYWLSLPIRIIELNLFQFEEKLHYWLGFSTMGVMGDPPIQGVSHPSWKFHVSPIKDVVPPLGLWIFQKNHMLVLALLDLNQHFVYLSRAYSTWIMFINLYKLHDMNLA